MYFYAPYRKNTTIMVQHSTLPVHAASEASDIFFLPNG